MAVTISIDQYNRSETLHSLERVLTTGILGTLVDITLFYYLQVTLGWPTLAANTISYSAGIVNNFVLNRHSVWSHRQRKTTGIQFLQFVSVSLIALLINSTFVLLLADPRNTPFAQSGNAMLLAKICATGVGICWNYLVDNLWLVRGLPTRSNLRRAAWSR